MFLWEHLALLKIVFSRVLLGGKKENFTSFNKGT